MKLNLSALQLLALCQFAASSPCKPSRSPVTTGLTTADITTRDSTASESVTISETSLFPSSETWTETELETATTTTEMMATSASATTFETEFETENTSTEPITLSDGATTTEAVTTVSATVPFESETETETMMTEVITASETTATSDIPLIPTTSAEPTTTTSSIPQQPTNLLRNPSFEEGTISPWTQSAKSGTWGLSTSESRTGAQSVRFSFEDPLAINANIRQQIDPSLLQANKMYDFTVYTLATMEASCATRIISCHSGTQNIVGSKLGSSANPGTWQPLKVSCTWSQAQLDAGVFIRIFVYGPCVKMDWFMDDVTFVEAV